MSGKNGHKAGRDQSGRFTTGNPGKPKGARHKTTQAVEALLEGQAEAITQTAIKAALDGDMAALRICLERISPPKKDRPISANLPAIRNAQDLAGFFTSLTEALTNGEVTPAEARILSAVAVDASAALGLADFDKRLAELEGKP